MISDGKAGSSAMIRMKNKVCCHSYCSSLGGSELGSKVTNCLHSRKLLHLDPFDTVEKIQRSLEMYKTSGN